MHPVTHGIVARNRCGLAGLACCALVACAGGSQEPLYPDIVPEPAAERRAPLPNGTLARAQVVELVNQGLGSFLQRVQLEPSLQEGKFSGFRLLELQPPTFWEGVDLMTGDVVTHVNGKSIEAPEQAFEVFESLRQAKTLSVSYLRGGKLRRIVFPIAG